MMDAGAWVSRLAPGGLAPGACAGVHVHRVQAPPLQPVHVLLAQDQDLPPGHLLNVGLR